MANLKAHAEIVGPLVQQQDGEDLVIDDRADELRRAMHERLQVEGGIKRVGHAHEELGLQGIDPHPDGRSGCGYRPVVSFKGVFRRRIRCRLDSLAGFVLFFKRSHRNPVLRVDRRNIRHLAKAERALVFAAGGVPLF